jgi:phosphoglucosamine mutase
MDRIEFGADGIRGIVGEWPLVAPVAVRIGQALGRFVCGRSDHPSVVIGRDTRPSGERLLHNLVAGLVGQGVDVIDLGVMTTPGVAFLTRREEADLGVIVSASHSPLEYNGIKLVTGNGLRLQREEEIEVELLIEEAVAKNSEPASILGEEIDGQNLIELYVWDHVEYCPVKSLAGLNVVLDCANGAASRVAPEAFKLLSADVTIVNRALEGTSINYHCGSEYAREHPQDFAKTVRKHEARYGFAFDGDGDRLVIVDEPGRSFDGNDLLFTLAVYYHFQGLLRGNAVVTTRIANRGLEEALSSLGIRTVYTSKGDKNLEAMMWGGDYMLGGEVGGNIIINDGHHTAADAVYAALVLGGVLAEEDNGLGKLLDDHGLKKHPQKTRSFEVAGPITLDQKEILKEKVQTMEAELGEGCRIRHWESSTEPGVYRVMVEGGRESTMEKVEEVAEATCQLIQRMAESSEGTR